MPSVPLDPSVRKLVAMSVPSVTDPTAIVGSHHHRRGAGGARAGQAVKARIRLSALLVGVLAAAGVSAQSAREAPGSTYASLANLPDWSGWWGFPQAGPDELKAQPLPLKPAAAAAAKA